MPEAMTIPWATILATAVSALAILYLRSIKQCLSGLVNRIEKNETEVHKLAVKISDCKIDCERQFVTAESFIKSESYTRKKLDNIAESFASLQGEIKVAAKLPEVVGAITREVVASLNQNQNQKEK